VFRKICLRFAVYSLLFIVFGFLFLIVTPKQAAAQYRWTIDPPVWSGDVVYFHWDSPADSVTSVVIRDEDDPGKTIVWDSLTDDSPIGGAQDYGINKNAWNVGPGIPIDGNFSVMLVVWGTQQSNKMTFAVPVGSPGWTIEDPPTWSGSTVTFKWDNPANYAMALIIVDWDDPTHASVWDSGAESVSISGLTELSVDSNNWHLGPGIVPDGQFAVSLVAYGVSLMSNQLVFTVGGNATWNNPGAPPPPFDIMDVFQPAKRFGSFGQLASDVLLILVSLAGALAIIFIMLSGFKFVTSSGDEKKLASARATLTYAIIGIAVVILAFVIVQILQYFLQSSIPIT